jgi:adenylyltransferase/sulfurtransferase
VRSIESRAKTSNAIALMHKPCLLYNSLNTGVEPMTGIPQLSVKELKRRIDAGEDVYLLDVREPFEYQIAQIGGKLIPQNDVPLRLAEIDRDREVIVHCRSGVRSQRIAEFLKQQGYLRVANLAGGILAWSDEIDPTVPKY